MSFDFDINNVWNLVLGVMALASTITMITPTPKDNKVVAKIYKVIEIVGLVIGRAKDK